jgi:hypothetical protein
MNGEVNTEVATLFHNLDAPFLRYETNKVEPIHWRTREFLVQFHHEIKVPATAGSIVKFAFTTNNGDISFALHFATPTNYVEVVRDATREPSDIEAIKGSYKADYDGVFLFIFDNSFSWFADKFLSYDIFLFQVCSYVSSYRVILLTACSFSRLLCKPMPIVLCKVAGYYGVWWKIVVWRRCS